MPTTAMPPASDSTSTIASSTPVLGSSNEAYDAMVVALSRVRNKCCFFLEGLLDAVWYTVCCHQLHQFCCVFLFALLWAQHFHFITDDQPSQTILGVLIECTCESSRQLYTQQSKE